MTFADARAHLDSVGLGPRAVQLPGDPAVPPVEGALVVERDADGWVLSTLDYGVRQLLGRAESEDAAARLVVDYVGRDLPAPRLVDRAELDALRDGVAHHYPSLYARAREAGGSPFLIEIPPGIPLDRIGVLDGVHLNPLDSSVESRSLPPTALSVPAQVHRVVTDGLVLVRVQLTPPWFGQPGGALRFTLADAGQGIRDLVADGKLLRLQLA
jgi:hypothetical protein